MSTYLCAFHFLDSQGLIFCLYPGKILDNERRCYLWNIFSHWLKSCQQDLSQWEKMLLMKHLLSLAKILPARSWPMREDVTYVTSSLLSLAKILPGCRWQIVPDLCDEFPALFEPIAVPLYIVNHSSYHILHTRHSISVADSTWFLDF